MDLGGEISLGPFAVPLRFLAMAACLAAAILVARIPLRGRRYLRAAVTDRLVNGVLIFVAGWKLAPAILHPRDLIRDPLPLLMGAPGVPGLIAGVGAAVLYILLALVRPRRLRRAAVLPVVVFAAVLAAGLGIEALGALASPPGPPANPLSLPTLDGGVVSLEALRGRVVIVNFWATWCPPCRAELPALVSFARAQDAGGAVLLPVDLTFSEPSVEAVRAFAKEHGLDTEVLLDTSGAATRSWGVRAYPTTFVIDPQGRVSARWTGAVDAAWLRRETAAAARK